MNLIAHRGYQKDNIKENTYKSIKEAILNKKLIGVEFDVRMTKDNKIVLIHDMSINRTSNKTGYVNNMTLSELKKCNFGQKNYYQTIPTLNGILNLIKTNKIMLLEVKDNSELCYKEILNIININNTKNIFLMSFNKQALDKINYKNKILITLLLDKKKIKNYNLIAFFYKLIKQDDIKYLIKDNKQVFLWTLDQNKLPNLKKQLQSYYNKCYIITNI